MGRSHRRCHSPRQYDLHRCRRYHDDSGQAHVRIRRRFSALRSNALSGRSRCGILQFFSWFHAGSQSPCILLDRRRRFRILSNRVWFWHIQSNTRLAIRNGYVALYANDEIKFSSLTINVGLRWDYEQPRTERYNRFSTFDFNAAYPVTVPGVPAVKGVLTNPGQNGQPRGQFDSYYKAFGPRIGLAWTVNPQTVIRSGYGIFYSPRFGTTSAGNFGSAGATLSSSWVASLDGVTPLNSMVNPYPNGVFQTANTTAAQTQLGQSILIMDRQNISNNYNQQWNFNVQRQLPANCWLRSAMPGIVAYTCPSVSTSIN